MRVFVSSVPIEYVVASAPESDVSFCGNPVQTAQALLDQMGCLFFLRVPKCWQPSES